MNAKQFFSDRPIAYHVSIAKACGSVTAALFLSQLAYWSDKGSDTDGWIYKTQAQMEDETGLSRREQETARATLTGLGVLREERRGTPARLWYLINWDTLTNLIGGKRQSRMAESANLDCTKPPNCTETTTENTTETTVATTEPRSVVEPDPFAEEAKPPRNRRVKAGPAALYHWEKTHCRISNAQIEAVNAEVVSNRDMERWRKAVDSWVLRGYKPNNIEGQLEWYRTGVPTWKSANGKRPASREPRYDEGQLQREREAEGPWMTEEERRKQLRELDLL